MSARWTVVSLACLLGGLAATAGAEPAAEPIELFDGKDLAGWAHYVAEPDVPLEAVWSVRDGLLVGRGEPLGYLYTKDTFTSFELVVEWRWAPGKEPGNSGVLMRIGGEPRTIPQAYEAQLKSGDAGELYGFWGRPLKGDPERMHGAEGHELLGDLSGVHRIEGNENPPGEWNRYEIRFDGPDIVVRVNGKKVNEATGAAVAAGHIGLQSEGGEIHFRRVSLTPLD